MAEAPRPAIFTIPPHRAFADALVTGILAQFGKDRMAMARGTILLPNARAARAITDAFVRRSENGLLLPRLVAIGDPELDERTGAMLDPLEADAIPPAIDPLRRQFLLARLIQQERAIERNAVDMAEAMRLAGELGRVLDQLHVEQVEPSRLGKIDTGGLSRHWQTSLNQLGVILHRWPEELARIGCIDLADRRNRQLEAVATRWRDAPPPGFVIAAGIGTTAPAIAALLKNVAYLAEGQVVLAGFDATLPEEEWAAIVGDETSPAIETHPQFHLALLLHRMDIARGEVAAWRWGGGEGDARASRSAALSRAMAPAKFTRDWADLKNPAQAFKGVHALELATPAEEAQAIAIALRESVEVAGQTAALVTPDRDLAGRVSALLERWGIKADDSAGQPLSTTPPGALLMALATAAVEKFAPVPLLALIKHPLVQRGEARIEWLNAARSLDLALRGPRPAEGLAGVAAFLRDGDDRTSKTHLAAVPAWDAIQALLVPIEAGFAMASPTLPHLLATLREGLSALAGDDIWSGQAGRMLADLLADIEAHGEDGPTDVNPNALPQLLRHLLDAVPVRAVQGGHPRIAIWGLIEAQLQSAHLMILGGLNEGVWPALAAPDPWLAPAIRKELGLPSLERRIGLSAHDLAGAMGAPHVLMTRAKRDARSPAIASRFWLRLDTMTGGLAKPPARYDLLARALDHAAMSNRNARPAPAPPVGERPHKISVTEVDGLNADPFAFYARKLLALAPLEAIDADPGPAWRGSLIHRVLEDWAKAHKYDAEMLPELMRKALATPGIHPLTRTLWEPRFLAAAAWIAANVATDRADGRMPLLSEEKGTIVVAGVTLSGKADRIDQVGANGLAIVDYKTGAPPSLKMVGEGYARQLGLIALIAERGGYADAKGVAELFEYWSLARDTKTQGFGYRKSPTTGKNGLEPESFVADTLTKFAKTVGTWLTGSEPFTAKLKPDYAYHDYDHLMRLEEWQGRQ